MYELPTTVSIDQIEHNIRDRGDYRAILDTIAALVNPDLQESGMFGNERVALALAIFYEDCSVISDMQKAFIEMCKFIDLGDENHISSYPSAKLYDWDQDRNMIAGAVSKVYGEPVRAMPYLHWWDFISAFNEIGEGQFSFVCSLRSKLQKNSKLEKYERDFIHKNPHIVHLKVQVSTEDQALLDSIFSD